MGDEHGTRAPWRLGIDAAGRRVSPLGARGLLVTVQLVIIIWRMMRRR